MSIYKKHSTLTKNRVLCAWFEFICLSNRARDFGAREEFIRSFNALGIPDVFVGVHNTYVHLTQIGNETCKGVGRSASLLYLADVVWHLDPERQEYTVIKDRSGLYKGTYRV